MLKMFVYDRTIVFFVCKKNFVQPWPKELESDEKCEYFLPIEITTYDYLNSVPSIRDSRARVVKFNVVINLLHSMS